MNQSQNKHYKYSETRSERFDFACPLSAKAVEEFKTLYLKKYGIQLTDREAVELGSKLISFLRRIGYPCNSKKL